MRTRIRVLHVANVPACYFEACCLLLSFVFLSAYKRCPLTAAIERGEGDKLCLDHLFWVRLHVEQAVLFIKRAACSPRVLPNTVVVPGQQTSDQYNSVAYMQSLDCDFWYQLLVAAAFSSLARNLRKCLTILFPPALFFSQVEISSHTLIPLFMPGLVHVGSTS